MKSNPRNNPLNILMSIVIMFLTITYMACENNKETDPKNSVSEIKLTSQIPQEGRTIRWSPKGFKLSLTKENGGLETEILLGDESSLPIPLRLEKSGNNPYYDTLLIDKNKDGSFTQNESLKIEPQENRGKMWSSFATELPVPVIDPWTGSRDANTYPLSFWFVEDPNAESMELVLRFSRRGWMEGRIELDGEEALVLLTESEMDGIFDSQDSWALALTDNPEELFDIKSARNCDTHAWLGEKAFRIKELHPSGRKIILESFDPGLTREEEELKNDPLALDKKAARSGEKVAFLHDFKAAEEQAQRDNKPLFIDFETTWCGPCKTMDKLVYTADLVVAVSRNVISVKVDGDEHPEIVKRFEVEAYPTLILLSPEGKVIKIAVGYRGVKEMTAFLMQ
ncbi:thioredoxin family protein [Acidobacteriota bacterium]